jgi:hypothetical protein
MSRPRISVSMTTAPRFSKPALAVLNAAKILGVRAGTEHKFTGVWVVVVKGRVFARSWNDKSTGWCQAFVDEPLGVIQIPKGRELRVRAKRVRGEGLLDAIDEAYGEKYNTPASRKWVHGFAQARRRKTTTEFVPR